MEEDAVAVAAEAALAEREEAEQVEDAKITMSSESALSSLLLPAVTIPPPEAVTFDNLDGKTPLPTETAAVVGGDDVIKEGLGLGELVGKVVIAAPLFPIGDPEGGERVDFVEMLDIDGVCCKLLLLLVELTNSGVLTKDNDGELEDDEGLLGEDMPKVAMALGADVISDDLGSRVVDMVVEVVGCCGIKDADDCRGR